MWCGIMSPKSEPFRPEGDCPMLKRAAVIIVLIGPIGPVPAQETARESFGNRRHFPSPIPLPSSLSADGTRVIRTQDGAEMVYVPAGPFRMGHTRTEYESAI